jgi:hypothetical protein
MRTFVFASVIAAALAVKQFDTTQSNADLEGLAANHDITVIEADSYLHEDINAVNAEIDAWFDNVASPTVHNYADLVETAAWHTTEVENGELLDTCAEGTKCREEQEKKIKAEIHAKWEELLQTFKKDVHSTVLSTEVLVAEGWETAVQCEVDHPCCTVSETVWKNVQTQITQTHELVVRKRTEYEDLERRKHEIETMCPDVDFSPYLVEFTPLPPAEDNEMVQTTGGAPSLD